jgi:hypothetical protein
MMRRSRATNRALTSTADTTAVASVSTVETSQPESTVSSVSLGTTDRLTRPSTQHEFANVVAVTRCSPLATVRQEPDAASVDRNMAESTVTGAMLVTMATHVVCPASVT